MLRKNVFPMTLCIIAAMLTLSGCSIFPEIKSDRISYFDIGADIQAQTEYRIKVERVTAIGTDSTKMAFRTDRNEVDFDEFNQWSYSPSVMIKNYFDITFSGTKSAPPSYFMDVNILKIEYDLKAESSILVLDATVKDAVNNKMVFHRVFCEKIKSGRKSASEFATGTEKALKAISTVIESEIKRTKAK